MRNGCNVFDKCYIQTCCLQGTDCSFTTAAGAFYENFNCLQTVIGSSFCSCICSHLCCIGCGFSGTSKAQLTSTCPGKRIPCCVSNCNDCIIESGLDMSLATFYFSFITASASRCLFSQFSLPFASNLLIEISNYFFLFSTVFLGPFLVLAFVFVF